MEAGIDLNCSSDLNWRKSFQLWWSRQEEARTCCVSISWLPCCYPCIAFWLQLDFPFEMYDGALHWNIEVIPKSRKGCFRVSLSWLSLHLKLFALIATRFSLRNFICIFTLIHWTTALSCKKNPAVNCLNMNFIFRWFDQCLVQNPICEFPKFISSSILTVNTFP